ncbi:MAG: diaminopimelate epimerase [Verrucomicrobiota bacterium]
MNLAFVKMTGAGNDFVCLNNLKDNLSLSKRQIAKICDRHFGVGADGMLIAEKSSISDISYRMRYHNADGGQAEMCGNGARCFANYLRNFCGLSKKRNEVSFMTKAGVIKATFLPNEEVKVQLTAPKNLKLDLPLKLSGGKCKAHSLDTGVPHALIFVQDLEALDISRMGREVRNHEVFRPAGTNVNFVQQTGKNAIRVRTYERGVEDETLACGTGVTAAALVSHLKLGMGKSIKVKVQGGPTLKVAFNVESEKFTDVSLTGPATVCYKGTIEI